MTPPDVVVVGGGVIGAACARALASREMQVVLCEPGPLGGAATPASAGMLAAQIEPDEDLLPLAIRARDLYAPLAVELRASTGLTVGLWRRGALSVAFTAARTKELQHAVAWQRRAGLRCEWLAPEDLAADWRGLAPGCRGALYAPDDGAVDPAALARALLADAARRGVVVVPRRVTALLTAAGRAAGVTADGAAIPAAHVVLAAGAWSPTLTGLPRALPIEPVRGQIVSLSWPEDTPRAIVFNGHHYVLARGDAALCGSTMERAGFDARVTADGVATIRREAERLLPALAGRAVSHTWAGLRPMMPDGRPLVGQDPEVPGLWYATGHGRNGILLAGLTGEIVAELVATGGSALDITPLLPRWEAGGGG